MELKRCGVKFGGENEESERAEECMKGEDRKWE